MSSVGADALAAPLLSAYAAAWDRIIAQLVDLAASPRTRNQRRRLVAAVQAIRDALADVDAAAAAWATQQLPEVYVLGGVAGAAAAASDYVFSQIDTDAVRVLANGLLDELLAATRHTNAQIVNLVRTAAGEAAFQALIEGRGAAQAARELRDLLSQSGVLTLRYNDGSIHTAREYATMAIRTTTARAYNIGTLNGGSANGIAFWEIFDGPDCGLSFHDDPLLANGLIVDTNVAATYVLAHPSCRRSFGGRPDLALPSPATKGLGSTTATQDAAQRAADATRAARASRVGAPQRRRQAVVVGRGRS